MFCNMRNILWMLGAIALSGASVADPIDRHGNVVPSDQSGKYALIVLGVQERDRAKDIGLFKVDGEPINIGFFEDNPTELNIEPGFHRIEAMDSERKLITYGLTVEAGYRYVIPFFGVYCSSDAQYAHEIAEANKDRTLNGRTPKEYLDMSRVRNSDSSGRTIVVASKEKDVVVSKRDDPDHRELYRLEAIPTCDSVEDYRYFSNVERLAWIEEQRVRKEADAQRLLAEEKRLAYQQALPSILEKAWACAPVLHTEKVANWKFRQAKNGGQLETKDEAYERLHQALLEFRECQDQADTEQLRRVFIREYVCGYESENSKQGRRLYGNFWPARATPDWEPRSWDWDEFEDTILHEVYLCSDRVSLNHTTYSTEFSKREELRLQGVATLRKAALKAGEIAVANFDDAMLLLEPKQLDQIMASPLLKADNKVYAAEVRIDGNDEHMLRAARGGGRNFIGEWVAVSYAGLKMSKSATKYLKSEMRIGGVVKVIGRYIGNTEYRTIGGEVKVMPILDVMYLGN
jgi:hypothetical protein